MLRARDYAAKRAEKKRERERERERRRNGFEVTSISLLISSLAYEKNWKSEYYLA
jgi:hypothetical protein